MSKDIIKELPPPHGEQVVDLMILVVNMQKKSTIVRMKILGMTLTNTIVDGGSRVNVLPEDRWMFLGKPTLWPPTFQLVGANQHGIQPLGVVMEQKVMVGTQQFLLNFVLIP